MLGASGHGPPGPAATVDYQRERRELAKARRAAFVGPLAHRNQVWQLDFSEFETTRDGEWQISGCTDYFAKVECPRWISTTQMRHDAIESLRLAVDHGRAAWPHTARGRHRPQI